MPILRYGLLKDPGDPARWSFLVDIDVYDTGLQPWSLSATFEHARRLNATALTLFSTLSHRNIVNLSDPARSAPNGKQPCDVPTRTSTADGNPRNSAAPLHPTGQYEFLRELSNRTAWLVTNEIDPLIRETVSRWDQSGTTTPISWLIAERTRRSQVLSRVAMRTAVDMVEELAQALRLPINSVLRATGIAQRTFYDWKRSARRPRVNSVGQLSGVWHNWSRLQPSIRMSPNGYTHDQR